MPVSLIPDRLYGRYTDLTPRLLADQGIRLLLCDLDYTLAPRSMERPDETLRAWLDVCRDAGVTVMILSNNRSTRRVETFCGELDIRYVGHAGKPSPKGYRQAMAVAGEMPEHTAMLGDKLLTDVLGAKRAGIAALMVEPLGGPVGIWNHVLHALQSPFKWIAKRRCKKNYEQIS
ncbi:MAG: YqeG family HAD IIIA-type phosphatase [Oscillospiraceae bacterium]|nr:YqeG family HAD IIIA-type phosphatase [Oscillospiraceae bacterium]